MTYLEKAKELNFNLDEEELFAYECPDYFFGLQHECPDPNGYKMTCKDCWNREMPEVKNE